MIRVGEEAGSLDTMMEKAADYYEGEVEMSIRQMTTLIEPLITLIMGVVIAFIMISIVMPMFSIISQI
jgi:type IV pilus assembly protein PilC